MMIEYRGVQKYLMVEAGLYLAKLGSRINLTAPVQSLPVEILLETFVWYIYPHQGTSYINASHFRSLNTLATVCRSWAAIVNGHCPFWAFARPLEPVRAVERALRRSKDSPLTIIWAPGVNLQPRTD